jgi:hypothetical protein
VVLADAEKVHAQAVRQLGLGDYIAMHLRVQEEAALGVAGDVAEGVETKLNGRQAR